MWWVLYVTVAGRSKHQSYHWSKTRTFPQDRLFDSLIAQLFLLETERKWTLLLLRWFYWEQDLINLACVSSRVPEENNLSNWPKFGIKSLHINFFWELFPQYFRKIIWYFNKRYLRTPVFLTRYAKATAAVKFLPVDLVPLFTQIQNTFCSRLLEVVQIH